MLKHGDFVEIDFIGRIKGSQQVFDLTNAEDAKKNKVFDEKRKYEPVVICLGAGKIFPKIETAVEGHNIGEEITVELLPEDAFGIKNPKLIQLVPLKTFKEKDLSPFPGLRLTVDGAIATVRSVTGGRVTLDFNHPLSGRNLVYTIKLNKQITKVEDKIKAISDMFFNTESIKFGDKIEVKAKAKPNEKFIDLFKKKLEEFVLEAKGKPIDIA